MENRNNYIFLFITIILVIICSIFISVELLKGNKKDNTNTTKICVYKENNLYKISKSNLICSGNNIKLTFDSDNPEFYPSKTPYILFVDNNIIKILDVDREKVIKTDLTPKDYSLDKSNVLVKNNNIYGIVLKQNVLISKDSLKDNNLTLYSLNNKKLYNDNYAIDCIDDKCEYIYLPKLTIEKMYNSNTIKIDVLDIKKNKIVTITDKTIEYNDELNSKESSTYFRCENNLLVYNEPYKIYERIYNINSFKMIKEYIPKTLWASTSKEIVINNNNILEVYDHTGKLLKKINKYKNILEINKDLIILLAKDTIKYIKVYDAVNEEKEKDTNIIFKDNIEITKIEYIPLDDILKIYCYDDSISKETLINICNNEEKEYVENIYVYQKIYEYNLLTNIFTEKETCALNE